MNLRRIILVGFLSIGAAGAFAQSAEPSQDKGTLDDLALFIAGMPQVRANSPFNSVIADIIMQPEETELLKNAKSLGRTIHYGKYMIESQIDLVNDFLKIW